MEDNAVWQSRIERLATETAGLHDEIAKLETEVTFVTHLHRLLL
jgi:hypothetical protein